MPYRLFVVSLFGAALTLGGGAFAQKKIRTETIRPPAAGPAQPEGGNKPDAAAGKAGAKAAAEQQQPSSPEIITDLARLPPAVAKIRERILDAARSGDLQKLVTVMQSNETLPIFTFSNGKDPAAYWKANYPDSDGIEILSILITILQTGYVHVEAGTPQEMYVWPYFFRVRLKSLTPEQKVELFRIVTGSDFKEMVEFGAYNFYRLGISPDGTWQFFVAGD